MTELKMGRKEVLGEHCTNPEQERKTGFPLKSLGEDFTVASCEGRIQGQFEDWLQSNMIALIDKHRGKPFGEKLRRDFSRDYAAGKYFWPDSWDVNLAGEYVKTSLADEIGAVQLLYLLLKRCHRDMTRAKAAKIFMDNKDGAIMAINWAMGSPNLPAPKQEVDGAGTEEAKEGIEQTGEDLDDEPETLDSKNGYGEEQNKD